MAEAKADAADQREHEKLDDRMVTPRFKDDQDIRHIRDHIGDQEGDTIIDQQVLSADIVVDREGVDGVFLGPSDLSAALGYLGQPGHPEVVATIERSIASILSHGKAAGILTPDRALAKRYLELGCTFVAVGLDARVLAQGVRELKAAFKP